ncbi:hypothetical protein V2A60_000206 [Cordyceps javanica]
MAMHVPYRDGLDIGQAYNTFVDRGLKHNAVIITPKKYVAADTINGRSERPGDKVSTGLFPFIEPNPVNPDVNLDEYFVPISLEDFHKLTEEAVQASSDKEKRDGASGGISGRSPIVNSCQGEIQSDLKLVTDYASYLKALGVNAATTISGYGEEASLSGGYLDESTFSSNSLTYIASISFRKQHPVPDELFTFNNKLFKNSQGLFSSNFGNRWIRGFNTGGKLVIKIMLTFGDAFDKEEIKADAQASLSFWGVNGKINTQTKSSLEKLSKKAQVTVKTFYQGHIGRELQKPSEISDKDTSAQEKFETAISWAEVFLKTACDHDYKYETILDEYNNVEGFNERTKIPHYTSAGEAAYLLLGEMVKHTELRQTLLKQEALNETQTREISSDEMILIDEKKKWLRDTLNNPDDVLRTVKPILDKSVRYYTKWKPFLREPSLFEVQAFGNLQVAKDPDTDRVVTYDCSQWYEWYGKDKWTWSRVQFCVPKDTDVFKLTVFREESQYLWGSAWYSETKRYRSTARVDVILKRIESRPHSWKFSSGETRQTSFSTAPRNEKLVPGRYKVQASFHQVGPYWHDDVPLGGVVEFDINVSALN